jgi:rhodanese-related sulfurtransferase
MEKLREISPEEARQRLGEFHVIDVRGEHEFRGPLGRVKGSRLVPLPELEARARELPRDRPLLLVCRSGARSGKACEKLAALGIGPVVNLTGGMIGWNRAQLPIEQTDPSSLPELVDALVSWVAQVTGRDRKTVRDELREELSRERFSLEAMTHASVERAVDLVEAALRRTGPPPDLDLSLASFRRWLAVL